MNCKQFEHWRLSETLSVTNAAMLAVGIDPGEVEPHCPSNPCNGKFRNRDDSESSQSEFTSSEFVAVFSALRSAVMSNSLAAVLAKRTRPVTYRWIRETPIKSFPNSNEQEISYEGLIRFGNGCFRTNADEAEQVGALFILKEPDWSESTVSVQDLRNWMENRDFRPPFFFPSERPQEFRDPEHLRYSAKLACAVAAWENLVRSRPNKTVKQTISEWVREHGASYGLEKADGTIPENAVDQIAMVVNWETKGGAVPTGGQVRLAGGEVEEAESVLPARVENFRPISAKMKGEERRPRPTFPKP